MKLNVIASDDIQAKINAKAILKNEGYKNIDIIDAVEVPVSFDGLEEKLYTVEYDGLCHKEEQINIELLKKERNNLLKLQKQMKNVLEQKEILNKKIDKITRKCDHRIVVQTIKELSENDCYTIEEKRCLLCNKRFSAVNDMTSEESFENVIQFENLGCTSSEKTDLAFNMFCEIKEENPELSDSEVVEKINNNKPKVKVKK